MHKIVTEYPVSVYKGSAFMIAEVRGMESGAWAQGGTREEALKQIPQAIEGLSVAYFKLEQVMPEPGEKQPGDVMVRISYDAALKIALRDSMLLCGVTKSDLARRLKILPQTLETWLRFGKSTKLDSLAAAFAAIDAPLEISCPRG